ncbi:hypothetical protein PoB_003019800 [Plakobranchus ocellatus]|uniref:Uncharacterized protein n=1 Tax=Plakobranchus ocellatus TaxID=259542 RepID=A0AAV4AAB4_9GAST|nr:hypothetical protein PoB_003019800 [Plakobranchus ocellatus]
MQSHRFEFSKWSEFCISLISKWPQPGKDWKQRHLLLFVPCKEIQNNPYKKPLLTDHQQLAQARDSLTINRFLGVLDSWEISQPVECEIHKEWAISSVSRFMKN